MIYDFSPRTDEGYPVSAPTFEATGGLHPQWHGHLYDVSAGSYNIFDEPITVEKQLRGGWYEFFDSSPVVGDYIEFSVVDKDDVLGLFPVYGLTVGQDIIELKKYVKTEYINPAGYGQRHEIVAKSTFVVTAGLYLRTSYHSEGSQDFKLKVTTVAYE